MFSRGGRSEAEPRGAPASRPLREGLEGVAPRGALLRVGAALADGALQGRHAKRSRGTSTEFYDYQAMLPGEPVAGIDWRLLGRSDRLYRRRFAHEAQASLMIVLDAGGSMRFAAVDAGRGAPTKLRRAEELAAGLALIAARAGDRVGLVTAGSAASASVIEPAAGWRAVHRVVDMLERLEAGAGRAGLAAGVDAAATALPRGGVMAVVTDGLDDQGPLLASLRAARGGRSTRGRAAVREVIVLQVLAADELRPPVLPDVRLVDPASGARAAGARDGSEAAAYGVLIAERCAQLRRGVLALGGRYALHVTDGHAAEALRAVLERGR
ncbi:MAG: DUF58 domain-containing protein [Planctomycetota bacterium]|nr:DUF58 domain-containing protein [Planctomycetota bacterium]